MSLHNEDYQEQEDDDLIERKEEILAELTKGKGTSLDDILLELCEIERELTLRET